MGNKILGKHYLIDFYNCDNNVLSSVQNIEKIMNTASLKGNLHVVQKYFKQFLPYGVSGIMVLSESHFTIHTWPEYQYASVDLYLCSDDNNIEELIDYLTISFCSKKIKHVIIDRGIINFQEKARISH